MPNEITCSRCRGTRRVRRSFLFISWKAICPVCGGAGRVKSFDPPSRPENRHFGVRPTPPRTANPSQDTKATTSSQASASTESTLDPATMLLVTQGVANALQLPPETTETHNAIAEAADLATGVSIDTGGNAP